MEITFNEYDEMLEIFNEINTKTLWPTLSQIDNFEKNPEKWIVFCCYLLENGDEPKTNEEKYSKKNIRDFINRHLELVD